MSVTRSLVNHSNLVRARSHDIEVALNLARVLFDQEVLQTVSEYRNRDIEALDGELVHQVHDTVHARLEELDEITVAEQECTLVLAHDELYVEHDVPPSFPR